MTKVSKIWFLKPPKYESYRHIKIGNLLEQELKNEIQNYVKKHTAPYKYPRIVVFRDELPKTISGKIMRNKL